MPSLQVGTALRTTPGHLRWSCLGQYQLYLFALCLPGMHLSRPLPAHTNPTALSLPSCCALQVSSKVVCMAWTADGMLLALGLYEGVVSLRDKAGTEKHRFTASSSPVWSLSWSPGVSTSLHVRAHVDGACKSSWPSPGLGPFVTDYSCRSRTTKQLSSCSSPFLHLAVHRTQNQQY
jgi:hypothetical protein